MFRKIRVALLGGIIAVSAFLLADQWRLYQNVPKNYVWNEVENFLKERAGTGDLVLFEPEWLAGYAQDFGGFKSYSVVTRQEAFKKQLPPSPKLWLISILKESKLARLLSQNGFVPENSETVYSVHLTGLHIPAEGVLYDFVERLPEAQVTINYGEEKIEKADWMNRAWVFKSDPIVWNQVSIQSQSFRGQDRRCIWFHPLEAGVKTLSFSNVPLGKKIQLFGGLVDSALLTPPGFPVFFFVKVGDQRIKTIEFKDTDTSFQHSLDLGPFQTSRQSVTFEVQTAGQARRHFCFAAWSES